MACHAFHETAVAGLAALAAGATADPLEALLWGTAVVAALCAVFWPRWGGLSRWQRARRIRERVRVEDALKHIHKTEIAGRRPTLQSLAGSLEVNLNRAAEVVADLQHRELLELPGSEMRLSAEGRRYAVSVIRAHRLWEQHLAEQTGVAESEWHRRAERQEHFLSPEQAGRLAAQLGNPLFDPHGDPIPGADTGLAPEAATSIANIPVNGAARIVHIEDEPEAVYAQLTAAGLYPGLVVRVLEHAPQRVRLCAQGEECVLAPVVAANLSVVPVPVTVPEEPPGPRSLSVLPLGGSARVARLSPRCRGAERRRLMDLGILPGTMVRAELGSPGGNLKAYRVRGALIALRREQSDLIQIEVPEEPAA
ncbi:MAG: FeoA domain-containing protein [Verrucomicrobia bacterium]|nr:FeoA domain-containing protein [Verrucomicrobiota bacterium]